MANTSIAHPFRLLALIAVMVTWAGTCYASAYRAYGWPGVATLAVLSVLLGVLSRSVAVDRRGA
ncbi:hypothetical protein [Nocardia terpenica]|uniref:Uncharacterized protein n=1 Tax=Nocardia terpenica TaxID=455432 RepID=A0A164MEC3_9NOCA|nr:hypothetical protein [Nocardia terpenica]KZM73283.1 hypothetical protein AWN90_31970 [Nocardia terpenica]NQE87571.1 hypothetical protein [Nocardia terpenica]